MKIVIPSEPRTTATRSSAERVATLPVIRAMPPKPMWAIECLDSDEALELLASAPVGSHIEQCRNGLVILWVPVPDDVIEHELGENPWEALDAETG